MYIRKAHDADVASLNALACRSEAYWGYNDAFMNTFKSLYSLSEDTVRHHPTYVLEQKGSLIGFFSLSVKGKEAELDFFYIDPLYIGKGFGKVLWEHLISICNMLSIKSFVLVTSPQAKGFYLRMGAAYLCDVDSSVEKNRRIPKFLFTLA